MHDVKSCMGGSRFRRNSIAGPFVSSGRPVFSLITASRLAFRESYDCTTPSGGWDMHNTNPAVGHNRGRVVRHDTGTDPQQVT
jgi:hypothetical protein